VCHVLLCGVAINEEERERVMSGRGRWGRDFAEDSNRGRGQGTDNWATSQGEMDGEELCGLCVVDGVEIGRVEVEAIVDLFDTMVDTRGVWLVRRDGEGEIA
jgi:hypothetical protein